MKINKYLKKFLLPHSSIFKKVDPENNADHVSLELRNTKSIV